MSGFGFAKAVGAASGVNNFAWGATKDMTRKIKNLEKEEKEKMEAAQASMTAEEKAALASQPKSKGALDYETPADDVCANCLS